MTGKSRWADSEAQIQAQKLAKEEKKRLKLEKVKRLKQEAEARDVQTSGPTQPHPDSSERPAKRPRLSPAEEGADPKDKPTPLLRFRAPGWGPCRHVGNFETLNHIEEGSYGWVSRARETATGEIVALKKLKMNSSTEGFPVTALREIQCLQMSAHRNIVDLKEVVVGSKLTDVYLVMEFVEHDLKALQEDMAEPFLASEIKTIILQMSSALEFLHDHWIIHRDLKTSNILLTNHGTIKLADFGMARRFSSPPPANLTQLVVTLWYRAPELLLGAPTYDFSIDMWSLGCVLGELLLHAPLLTGKTEADQLSRTFALVGAPTDASWPGFRRLPNAAGMRFPSSGPAAAAGGGGGLRAKFPDLTAAGVALLGALLALHPARRPTAAEVLRHAYFEENPRPKSEGLFPTFPSRAGLEKRRKVHSPRAPERGEAPRIKAEEVGGLFEKEREEGGKGWKLRVA